MKKEEEMLKPVEILDYQIVNEKDNRIIYKVAFDKERKDVRWVEDSQLVGSEKLVNQFFKSKKIPATSVKEEDKQKVKLEAKWKTQVKGVKNIRSAE